MWEVFHSRQSGQSEQNGDPQAEQDLEGGRQNSNDDVLHEGLSEFIEGSKGPTPGQTPGRIQQRLMEGLI